MAMTKSLCEQGARVAILSRDVPSLQLAEAKVKSWGHTVETVEGDVCDVEQLKRAHESIRERLGALDILINAAGGNQKGATISADESVLDIDPKAMRSVIDLNLMGSLLPIQVFGRDFIERKSGIVINISSMSAFRPLTRVAGYSASKAAISNLTQWLAVELAQKYGEGIRVNAIAPGFFLTEQNRELLTNPDGTLTERGKRIIDHTPFGRFGHPDELIGTLLWLCSDASKFVTGAIIPVDGGFNAYAGV
jgi:NAD(P)-dependent dehydrogenase (short-subunit alcohol dehydrogenase family)